MVSHKADGATAHLKVGQKTASIRKIWGNVSCREKIAFFWGSGKEAVLNMSVAGCKILYVVRIFQFSCVLY